MTHTWRCMDRWMFPCCCPEPPPAILMVVGIPPTRPQEVPVTAPLFILAATTHEAYRYCHRAGIQTRNRRIILRRGQIVGTRTAVVHALPSFKTAPQRHSILAGLKWLKVEWHDVEMPPEPFEDQGDGMGEQLVLSPFEDERLETLDHLIESAERAADEHEPGAETLDEVSPEVQARYGLTDTEEPDGQSTGTPEPSKDAAPAPTRRRRARCKDCGELKPLDDAHDCPMATEATPATIDPLLSGADDADPIAESTPSALMTESKPGHADSETGDPFATYPRVVLPLPDASTASDGFF